MISIGSLFSGIGGIELGFERAGGFETKWFVENDLYTQAVLRKHWPDTPIYGDIKTINFKELPKVDILTGGFPCQDISNAGKRKGITGERSGLWKEYLRAICEVRPKYAVIENVSALRNRGLSTVLLDLAENGYDAEWYTLSARDVGALHKRERVFIIANTNNNGTPGQEGKEEQWRRMQTEPNNCFIFANTNKERCGRRNNEELRKEEYAPEVQGRDFQIDIANDWSKRIQRFREKSLQGKQGFSWCKDVGRIEDLLNRQDIPEPLIRGESNGLSCRMDRTKCIGNAVVPQCAEFIAEIIKEREINPTPKQGGEVR